MLRTKEVTVFSPSTAEVDGLYLLDRYQQDLLNNGWTSVFHDGCRVAIDSHSSFEAMMDTVHEAIHDDDDRDMKLLGCYEKGKPLTIIIKTEYEVF